MPITRAPVQVDPDTFLIDTGGMGVWNYTSVYLIEADRRCLIDAGTRKDAPKVIQALREMDAFPPDVIVLTHSHYDHAQGVPVLRQAAAREGVQIEVIASRKALPLLADPSYQVEVFGPGPYASITDVTPLDEGDSVDLGSTSLTVYDVLGHSVDQVALLDERTKNLYVGDAVGAWFGGPSSMPLFFKPFWDTEAFYATVDKLRQIDYGALCLAHFGPLRGEEAKAFLDRAVTDFEHWWGLFEANQGRLDDTNYLVDELIRESPSVPPQIEAVSPVFRAALALITAWNRLIHGSSWSVAKLFLPESVHWKVECYRSYTEQHNQSE